jgi:bacillithiol biosynthesis cysteine-adding enzyme BshC
MNGESLSFRETESFSQLICDYLDQDLKLKDFYGRFPSIDNFQGQIDSKSNFSSEIRAVLSSDLFQQYHNAGLKLNPVSSVYKNITSLKEENTFTVTTGHQLNIFTGPLYFIYKIVNAINLARDLNKQYPQYNFVPIYWMATEDHDLEEINYINLYGGKLQWPTTQKGAVGRMNTDGIDSLIEELSEHLGLAKNSKELITLFKKAYLNSKNLADATRRLAHELFSEQGLVIVDGDRASLKHFMKPAFKEDLLQHSIGKKVLESSEKLNQDYFSQVFPRDINLFYLKGDLRERIVKEGGQWTVINSNIAFNEETLLAELESYPERFSPNVVLRPLYQETILPNLAYIGGGGEIAYWFQLKAMFDQQNVEFPCLILRNSVLWIEPKWQNRLADTGLAIKDLFKPLHKLQAHYLKDGMPVDPSLEEFETKIEQIFNELEEIAQLTEKSMLGAVNAQRQKQLNGLANLKKKLVRAEKRKHKVDMEKIDRIYYALFPNGSLQERYDNISAIYPAQGVNFINILLKELDPLSFSFRVLRG